MIAVGMGHISEGMQHYHRSLLRLQGFDYDKINEPVEIVKGEIEIMFRIVTEAHYNINCSARHKNRKDIRKELGVQPYYDIMYRHTFCYIARLYIYI